MLEHSIYPSPSKPATSPLCSPYYRYSSELSSSFCILSFLVKATSIDQTFYSATHYLAAVWLDSRHGPNIYKKRKNCNISFQRSTRSDKALSSSVKLRENMQQQQDAQYTQEEQLWVKKLTVY